MDPAEIMESTEFKRCAEFHGHVCPGLSMGFRAAKAGLAWLQANRSEDEEIVAIVETDACSADAVQVLTGCTFGKGNFIFKDYGKMALTLLSRHTGKGVRLCLKPDALTLNPEHQALMKKIMAKEADEGEAERFRELHQERSREILGKQLEALFTVTPVDRQLPAKARVEPSVPCERCGEPTMGSKLETVDGQKICRGCLDSIPA